MSEDAPRSSRRLADDPGASTDLREQAAAVLVQLGLNR